MRLFLKTCLLRVVIMCPPCVLTGVLAQTRVGDDAPGPFDFREAYLLESRIEVAAKGEKYDPYHSENDQSRMYYGMANQFAQFQADKRDKMSTYQSTDWVTILPETDRYREMGGLDLAEKQYLEMVEKLRRAQGLSSNHLALMLDHLAEFYLEERKFEAAFKTFTEAVTVQRHAIDSYSKTGAPAPASYYTSADPSATLKNAKLHLSDMLTRLGQIELNREELNQAKAHLTEAVAIVNVPDNVRYTDGLYAVYFLSKVFERQSRWAEAETLWKQTVQLREKVNTTAVYWDSRKEMAAFYARHNDFHSAAVIARDVQAGIALKTPIYEVHRTLLENRPRFLRYERYTAESSVAMSEIVAIDAWRTHGPEAGVALLKDPIDNEADYVLDRGSDAERTRLLAWFQAKVFLHMSILLDSQPSQDRINRAYILLSKVKGRYLAALSEATRAIESERGNPNVQTPDFATLDQLAAIREKQARLFLDSSIYGQEFDNAAFSLNDNRERILSNAIVSSTEAMNAHPVFSLQMLMKAVPADSAFVDILLWDRADRDAKVSTHREYGAFIQRNNQPIRYVRLDLAKSIDADIEALQLSSIGNQSKQAEQGGAERAVTVGLNPVIPKRPPLSLEEFQSRSNSLYKKVLAPIEPYLSKASRLYIVPDGNLALAPISALRDNSGHYVLESRTITYMGSSHDMASSVVLGSARPTSSEIVADPDFDFSFYGTPDAAHLSHPTIFSPLDSTKGEAGDVQLALKTPQSRVLTGKDARKWLIQSIENPSVLHFATHSDFKGKWTPPRSSGTLFEFPEPLDTQYPLLQSFIALAGANGSQGGPENGLLTGLEVASLHLTGTSLVVLSSCKSGQGALIDSQGVLGLRAAFAMAGTEGLVMTLWPVNDQAGRQFMKFFYGHLADGPSEAVRKAQLDMLKSKYADPFYWSGYLASESAVTDRNQQVAAERAEKPQQSASQGSISTNLVDQGAPQPFVTPNCFEILSHDDSQGTQYRTFYDVRVRIGGVVHRSQTSPTPATYDLRDFGNNIEASSHESNVLGSQQVKLASELNWLMQVVVDKTPGSSSVSFRFGPDRDHPEKNRMIVLKGGTSLFPSLRIPAALPPLSAYAQATDTYSTKGGVDKVGFCSVVH